LAGGVVTGVADRTSFFKERFNLFEISNGSGRYFYSYRRERTGGAA
jgi:hypothetical protein